MRPRGLDAVIAGGLGAASGISLAVQDAPAAVLVAQVVAGLSLAFRRTDPFVPPVAVLVSSVVMASAGQGPDDIVFLVIWIVGSYGSGAYLPWPRNVAALGIWWAALLLAEGAGLEWGDVVFLAALTACAWVPGVLAARSKDAQAESAAKAADEVERAARAVTDERLRIARELHDVVAHAVGIMVVQAAAAEQVMHRDPDRARVALDAVQETGRAAVVELSRMLYLLRDDDTDELAPLPSLTGLDVLSSSVRNAGLTVDVDLRGDLDSLPPGVGLSAYRVVQEGLTNAVKHAPGTHVCVRLERSPSAVEIEVSDTGPSGGSAARSSGGTGLGLIGLRERVSVFGGHLDAGPRRGGGFSVTVTLPLSPVP